MNRKRIHKSGITKRPLSACGGREDVARHIYFRPEKDGVFSFVAVVVAIEKHKKIIKGQQ